MRKLRLGEGAGKSGVLASASREVYDRPNSPPTMDKINVNAVNAANTR
jgi:hypothetical protein